MRLYNLYFTATQLTNRNNHACSLYGGENFMTLTNTPDEAATWAAVMPDSLIVPTPFTPSSAMSNLAQSFRNLTIAKWSAV